MSKCNICDKELKRTQKRFCSRDCWNIYQNRKTIETCKHCKNEFSARMNYRNEARQQFCSHKCYSVWLIGRPNKSNTKFKKGQTPFNKGKSGDEYLSIKARRKMGEYWRGRIGKNAANYKDGSTLTEEGLKERWRIYRQRPDYKLKHRLHQSRRRALINTTDDGTVTKENIEKMLIEQNYRCNECGKKLDKYHIDHKTPPKWGGRHSIKNIQLLCPKCNILKSDHLENNCPL